MITTWRPLRVNPFVIDAFTRHGKQTCFQAAFTHIIYARDIKYAQALWIQVLHRGLYQRGPLWLSMNDNGFLAFFRS